MLPSQLQAASFALYPPESRALAVQQLTLLRRMPLAFLPLLLREVIGFDWKFPVEKGELIDQFRYLASLASADFDREMSPFGSIRLTPDLEASDWIADPAGFSERLSAHLWSTHQIEGFREASLAYVAKLNASRALAKSELPRLTAVMLGQGVVGNRYPLFRKLRRHGTYYTNVDGEGGRPAIVNALKVRAQKHFVPYGHWYVDGSGGLKAEQVSCISYADLQAARERLITKMRQVMAPGGAGPEALRSMMARMTPQDLGLPSVGADELLNRFQISVLAEGSGTQLFSTTFVQWSAREVLRRAQPSTLVLSYAPRQREQSMQELLSGKPHAVELDAPGSLIDADMGAYYTWLNANRLPDSAGDTFLAWFEAGREAIVIGPGFEKNRESHEAVTLRQLLHKTGNLEA